jgi:hypothetical protein
LITKPPLPNTVGFVIKGEPTHIYSGFSVPSAGDVNGDGLDDLIIGAHHANPSGEKKAAVSCLPNTTYDLASLVPTIKSSKPSPLTSPALETECPLKSPADSPLISR